MQQARRKWLSDLTDWRIAEKHKLELTGGNQRRKASLIFCFAEDCEDDIAECEREHCQFSIDRRVYSIARCESSRDRISC
jgi:hypothetical protein